MSKQLLLLRHGKSDWSVACDDFHRPLKGRGRKGAKKIGVWMQSQQLIPDQVISSPAVRALSTAELCLAEIPQATQSIRQSDLLYSGTHYEVLNLLRSSPATVETVLLVGHNPDMEDLLLYLVQQEIPFPDDGKLMATATLACLAVPDDWQRLDSDCAKLLALTRAAFLA